MMRALVHERIVQFGPQRGLVGVLSQPAQGRDEDAPHVILLNSGIIHRVGSNRLYVELARALAANGVTTLRFDLSGIGDSTRRADASSVRESVQRDVEDAIAYMTDERGSSRVVLCGLCSGAFDAFRAAVTSERVVGAFMVDMPGPFGSWRHVLHHVGARILNSAGRGTIVSKLLDHSTAIVRRVIADRPTKPSAPVPEKPDGYVAGARGATTREQMSNQLDQLLARNARLFFVFTAGLELNYNHASQFRGVFPRAARHPGVSHAYLPDHDHAFATSAARSRLIALFEEWVQTTWLRRRDAA